MEYLENIILYKYPFIEAYSSEAKKNCENYISENSEYVFYCCWIKTYGCPNYSVVCDMYENECQKNKIEMLTQDDYLSECNRGIIGVKDKEDEEDEETGGISYCITSDISKADFIREGIGSGIVILKKEDLSLCKIIYVKDTLNMPIPNNIEICNNEYTIISNLEVSYIIYITDFSTYRFNGCSFKDFRGLLLVHPAYIYNLDVDWNIVDVKNKCVYQFGKFMKLVDVVYGTENYTVNIDDSCKNLEIQRKDNGMIKKIPIEELIHYQEHLMRLDTDVYKHLI